MKVLLKAFLLVLTLSDLTVFAMDLSDHHKNSKEEALCFLNDISQKDLWDEFLDLQTELVYDEETHRYTQHDFWKAAESVLDFGAGNGSYVSKLAQEYPCKKFTGLDYSSSYVERAKERHELDNLSFDQSNAEILNPEHFSKYDVIIFRFVLQHLKSPYVALQNAYHYLKPGGHLVIIDPYDAARELSHGAPSFNEAIEQHNLVNASLGKGNRKITMQILSSLEDKESLDSYFSLFGTNFSSKGELLGKKMKIQGDKKSKMVFNYILFYLRIVHRGWNIPVDFSKAYDELKPYQEGLDSWYVIPEHILILEKKA